MSDPVYPNRVEIRERQLTQLRALVRALVPNNAFYTPRLTQAGITPGLSSLEEFSANMPLTSKDEFAEDHLTSPPFGTNLTYPLDRYTRFSHTSGTTGKLLRWLDTPESWDWMLYNWELVLTAAGVRRGDRVYFPFSFGPFIGFWTAFGAAARMGCLCIPGGGLRTIARLEGIIASEATIICSTPTYAIRLGETAAEEGIDLSKGKVRRIVVAGESGGSQPEVRRRIESLWPGASVFDHHGMTEVGPVTYECPKRPCTLHVLETSHYAEVINPETGENVSSGEGGELVLTTLGRLGSPVLRYRTGDIVAPHWGEQCECGSWAMTLEGGIVSRVDDMVSIRGVNVYPSGVDQIVRAHDGIAEYQVEIISTHGMEEMHLKLEPAKGADGAQLAHDVATNLRSALSLRVPVTVVEAGSLPRFEMKARRWIRENKKSD